jgi:hypothetical protein
MTEKEIVSATSDSTVTLTELIAQEGFIEVSEFCCGGNKPLRIPKI